MTSPVDNIISAESGGDAQASNPNSSASGPGQFLSATWLDTLAKHRPDITGSQDELLALRNDPALSKEMTAAYASDNADVLSKAGLPVTNGSIYLSHFAGPGGAVKVMQADPSAPVSDILGPAVVKANPFLKDMTAQQLQAWAAKKMGTSAPVAGSQPQPQPAPAPANAAPAAPQQQQSPIPQQRPPIFAAQPQFAAGAPPAMPQMPAPAMPPIFAAQHKPIDLSGLRAALAARAPIFPSQGQT